MLHIRRILVSGLVLAVSAVGLAACGQKGVLFLPTEPAAAHRATLPQALRSSMTLAPAIPASAASAVAPALSTPPTP